VGQLRGNDAVFAPFVWQDRLVRTAYWERVLADGCRVPEEPLHDLTAEVVGMLGDPDPYVRDGISLSVLTAWITEGVYDNLLAALGDGLVGGLRVGIGSAGDDTVFRRSYSALALASVIARDNEAHVLPRQTVLAWADRAVSWLMGERDLRGWVPDHGWAFALGHGADLFAHLFASRHLGRDELSVLIEVVADRLLQPTTYVLQHGEPDRLAFATMSLLHRDLVAIDVLERWLDRLAAVFTWQTPPRPDQAGYPVYVNAAAYVRALHTQLLLGVRHTPAQDGSTSPVSVPEVRADLVIALQRAVRASAPWIFRTT
jgi:Protein of unknown function (DUF2785)